MVAETDPFGHPEVYIIALPFFGIVSEIFPVFSRKPIFGYKGLVYATIAIAALSVTVWAHHMYVTGSVLLPFFSFMTMLIAVPTGVKFFNWIGTMWRGSLTFETPMLWSIGFLITFLFGGLTGIILASPPLDFHVSDSYFVWPTSTTWCSAPWCSRCSPASTSGGRSGRARCSTSASARSTSGSCSWASTARS
jgi:heme/copper-type cytochrome/quinol oxidase subunit 1